MHLFPISTKAFRERAFSPLFLVALVMIVLIAGSISVVAINKAHANSALVQLSSLTMIDHQHGWAFDSTRRHVLTTHQGPEHWVDVTPTLFAQNPNGFVTNSFFLNATHGYIAFLQANNTVLLSTQDGGRTWQATPFTIPGTDPNEVGIIQITFLDAQHGWLSFLRDQKQPGQFDFVLMSTIDGGKTWQTILDTYQNPANMPTPYSTSPHFTFVDPQNGWVTGIWLAGDIYLYTTHDGGKTWTKGSILPVKGTHDVNFTQGYGPYWKDSQNGTLFVQYDTDKPHLTAYRTLDGGKSWILGPSTASTTSFDEISNLSFLNAQEGWSVGFDGVSHYVMHHTNTSGLKWDVFSPAGLMQANADQQVLSLTFITNTTGWLIIQDGQGNDTLFQTTTSGHAWYPLHPVIG